jgi:hypothetical protein
MNNLINTFGLHGVQVRSYRVGRKPDHYQPGQYMFDDPVESQNMTIAGSSANTGSLMGTPVFADIELYIDNVARLYNQSVLITINQQKNIVRTSVNNRKGTIKEYITDGDFSVQIQGILVGDGNNYPIDDVHTLHKLLSEPQNIKVISPYLELWGIYELTVETYNIPQQQGWQNIQPFELGAYSDEPIELINNA